MTIIDSFSGLSIAANNQDHRHHEETKGAFKALLRDMEQDYLNKQPHQMAENTRSNDSLETEVPRTVTQKQLEQWLDIADIVRQPTTPTQLYAAVAQTNTSANVVAAVQTETHGNTSWALYAAKPNQELPELEATKNSVQTTQAQHARPRSEQAGTLQTSGLHVYLTAEGVGLSYRNNQQDPRTGLDHVMQIKKILADQGKNVTEAYVNAQRLEFKGKQNGY